MVSYAASSWRRCVRGETSGSRGTPDLMRDRLQRRTAVGKRRWKALSDSCGPPSPQTAWSNLSSKSGYTHCTVFCFFLSSLWFSATSIHPTATRADCCRLHTVIGTCFWLDREREAVAFQGKMCKGSLTLHQRGLAWRPPNITVFMTATTQGRKILSVALKKKMPNRWRVPPPPSPGSFWEPHEAFLHHSHF